MLFKQPRRQWASGKGLRRRGRRAGGVINDKQIRLNQNREKGAGRGRVGDGGAAEPQNPIENDIR